MAVAILVGLLIIAGAINPDVLEEINPSAIAILAAYCVAIDIFSLKWNKSG